MPAAQYHNRKTPGVYVTELPAFPPSIVGVPTAIPVFVGYTEKAEVGGKSVVMRPVQINSLADFEQFFGGGYSARYSLQPVSDPTDKYDFRVQMDNASPPSWQAYQLVAAGTAAPAGPSEKDKDEDPREQPAAPLPRFNLYNSIRLFYANGGATCYVVSAGTYVDAGASPPTTRTVSAGDLVKGLEAAREQVGPTMIVVPDAVLLPPDNPDTPWVSGDFGKVAQAMMLQASDLQDRIAILDVYGAQYANTSDHPDATLDAVISQFRTDVGENNASNGEAYLSYGAAYFPFLHTTVISLTDVSYLNIDNTGDALTKLLQAENDRLYGPAPAAAAAAAGSGAEGGGGGGGGGANPKPGGSTADTKPGEGSGAAASPAENPRHVQVAGLIAAMDPRTTDPTDGQAVAQLNNNLVAALPVLKTIEQQVIAHNNVLPPSAAMAGVYTSVDANSGVWNAPANVTLASVDSPTLNINGDQQEGLNLPVDGKAVDVLRAFPGRGTVVWGARTLDGNSPDFRYVQVRRTLIYLEQSIKQALEPFVFAPNTGQTWATVTSMVSGFLTVVWTRGGLMGAKPSEAFSVACGLGSTMTGQDVLDGYMIVQVTLSLIRPAEFIELTFKQTMQGVG
jgi:phage tail sheath protein FI